ncbi:MAG: transporter substrate-binding domain-containing protein, partial [Limibaculum sp.]
MKKFIAGLAASAIALGAVAATAAEQCTNDVWNKVMQRGKIVVGVKADYKPWGYRNSDGSLVGMEIDMAREVADTLGVEIDIVAVQSSNRMQFLEQGKIDLMIATMSDRKDRRAIVGIVGPNYYTSGTNLLAPDALNFTEWEQIRGKPVCGKQGAFYNQIVEKRY